MPGISVLRFPLSSFFVSISRGWGHEPGRTSTRSALAVDARVQSDMGDRDGWTKSGDHEPGVYSFSKKPARSKYLREAPMNRNGPEENNLHQDDSRNSLEEKDLHQVKIQPYPRVRDPSRESRVNQDPARTAPQCDR